MNVLASVIFAGMSGSAVADASGLGTIEIAAMNEEGFDPAFSAAITAASSTIGLLFPQHSTCHLRSAGRTVGWTPFLGRHFAGAFNGDCPNDSGLYYARKNKYRLNQRPHGKKESGRQ